MIQHQFAIHFPDFFREPMTKWYSAITAGKAKYNCYLQFRDAYDMSFIDFLKIVKVWKMKDTETTEPHSEAEAVGG
jgi:hypothetical protein